MGPQGKESDCNSLLYYIATLLRYYMRSLNSQTTTTQKIVPPGWQVYVDSEISLYDPATLR